ncbi:hypothetical protein LQZ18_15130 [Lachnospiraceae bacterium ZAX-1]
MIDYRRYSMNIKEIIFCIFGSFLFSGVISYLFYRSVFSMVCVIIVFPIVWNKRKIYLKERQKENLQFQFRDCIQMAATALNAGYSLENAFVEARKDLVPLYGDGASMSKELQYMNGQVQLNIPLEKLIQDLAERSGVEDIQSFSQVFGFAKRGGGDFIKIFMDTVQKISERMEVMREIKTVMAAKKLEQNIMNIVPIGILFYIDLSSPGFLSIMYGNYVGILVMTICLLIYLGAYVLSEKIIDIKV